MTITTRDGIINGLGNGASRVVIDKASIANAVASRVSSLWRATGTPAQGAIPTAAAICTKALTGAIGFANQIAPASSYYAWQTYTAGNNLSNSEIHDRLAHMGGLNGTLLTTQNTNIDLQTLPVVPKQH